MWMFLNAVFMLFCVFSFPACKMRGPFLVSELLATACKLDKLAAYKLSYLCLCVPLDKKEDCVSKSRNCPICQ